MSDERFKIFSFAAKKSVENAREWLEKAKEALKAGPPGHAYSMSITANEELAKSQISWLVGNGVIHPDNEIVHRMYDSHEAKIYFMFWTYLKDELLADIEMGVIEPEALLRDAVTIPDDEVKEKHKEIVEQLVEYAYEVEQLRQEGVYVNVFKDEDEERVLTTPMDFPRDRAERAIEIVSRGLEIIINFQDLMEHYPELRKFYVKEYKKAIKSNDFMKIE